MPKGKLFLENTSTGRVFPFQYRRLFLPVLLAFALFASAQNTIVTDAITVNGLRVGERYTQEQFVEAFGMPTKIESPSQFDEYSDAYIFYYGEDRFYRIDGIFYGFEIQTSEFLVNGTIRVGNFLPALNALGGIKKLVRTEINSLYNWRPTDKGIYEWLSVDFYFNAQSRISYISAFINDL